MKYVLAYTFKAHMTPADTKAMLETFASHGDAPGAQLHYTRADGRGGFVVGETDDIAGLFAHANVYSPWVAEEVYPALEALEAVPVAGAAIGEE
jgi:hypothetical protein